MARITIEDCLEKVDNRYELVHLSVKRVKQLRDGEIDLLVARIKTSLQVYVKLLLEKLSMHQLQNMILTNSRI